MRLRRRHARVHLSTSHHRISSSSRARTAQPVGPSLEETLANCFIFHCDSAGPAIDAASFSLLAAACPKLARVAVGFFGFIRWTALSAGSAVITQSYRKPWETRSPNGVDGLRASSMPRA